MNAPLYAIPGQSSPAAAPAAPEPARVFASIGFTPAATTLTRNSALVRTGIGTSAARKTSADPVSSMMTARIVVIPASPPATPHSKCRQ